MKFNTKVKNILLVVFATLALSACATQKKQVLMETCILAKIQ